MKVVFKKDKVTNEVLAFMPYDIQNFKGEFTCYAHVGQHGLSCDSYYRQCINATEDEYKPLLNELKQKGYNVEPIKRINVKEFRQAYTDFLEHDRVVRSK